MATSTIYPNRVKITINGKVYSLYVQLKSVKFDLGTIASHVQTMTPDGSPGGILEHNTAPSCEVTESLVGSAEYINLFTLFRNLNTNPDIVFEFYRMGEQTPSGISLFMTGSRLSQQSLNFPDQAQEGTRTYTLIGITQTEII